MANRINHLNHCQVLTSFISSNYFNDINSISRISGINSKVFAYSVMRRLKGAFILIILFIIINGILGGCASVQYKPPATQQVQVDSKYLAKPDNAWAMIGKVSYQDGKNSAIVNIDWQQISANHYSIRIFNSLGGDIIRITQQDGNTKIRMRGEDILNPDNLAESIEEEIGYYVPLEQLIFWIKGQASGDDEFTATYDKTGSMLLQLQQNGWQIDYKRFERGVARRITATRNEYIITLAITSWAIAG